MTVGDGEMGEEEGVAGAIINEPKPKKLAAARAITPIIAVAGKFFGFAVVGTGLFAPKGSNTAPPILPPPLVLLRFGFEIDCVVGVDIDPFAFDVAVPVVAAAMFFFVLSFFLRLFFCAIAAAILSCSCVQNNS